MKKQNIRTDYSKISKRTEPTGVRFDIDSFERIKKERGLGTAQQVVNFLMKLYDDSFHPNQFLINPVMQRNASLPLPNDYQEVKKISVLRKDGSVSPLIPLGDAGSEKRIAELEKNISDAKAGKTKFLSATHQKASLYDWTKELNQLKNQ